jgi:lipoic acid synthetase
MIEVDLTARSLQTPPRVRKPDWLRVQLPHGEDYERVKAAVNTLRLHTVCKEAACPNIAECWGAGTATVMILGDTCTRGCRFCNVKTGNPRGVVDWDEPVRVAEAVRDLGWKYLVLTAVDRDDLADGGALVFANTVRAIHELVPGSRVEILSGDYRGDLQALDVVMDSEPDVFAHNLETVRRLSPHVRDKRANYDQSLRVLAHAKRRAPERYTKTSLMLGLGETEDEIARAMDDARAIGIDIFTMGQYLQPSKRHLPVVEFVTPTKFDRLGEVGRA